MIQQKIEMFPGFAPGLVRFGDVTSAGLVFAGTTWLGFAPKQFAIVNIVLIVVWLVVAVALGRRFQALAHSD